MIDEVKEYIAANSERNITPIYINNNNQQIWNQADSELRMKIYEYYKEEEGMN